MLACAHRLRRSGAIPRSQNRHPASSTGSRHQEVNSRLATKIVLQPSKPLSESTRKILDVRPKKRRSVASLGVFDRSRSVRKNGPKGSTAGNSGREASAVFPQETSLLGGRPRGARSRAFGTYLRGRTQTTGILAISDSVSSFESLFRRQTQELLLETHAIFRPRSLGISAFS